MSTSSDGEASRSFMTGSSEWPPARILASSLPCKAWIASWTLLTRWYSNARGYTLLPSPCLLHRRPDARRTQRHIDMGDPERRQRVDDRVDDGGSRGDRPCFAGALDAELVDW